MARFTRPTLAALAVLAAGSLTAGLGQAAPVRAEGRPGAGVSPAQVGHHHETRGNYDSRTLGDDAAATATTGVARRSARAAAAVPARVDLRIDPVTGTVRHMSVPTGFLTGPSGRDAAAVALDYVRAHVAALGLARADLDTLRLNRRAVDINGITHLAWRQIAEGVPIFGNGLRAHVDRRGRLIAVQGSPIAAVAAQIQRARAVRLDRGAAISAAAADARVARSELRPGATADRVWFYSQGRLRPGWLTFTEPGPTEGYAHVVDATSGRTLLRRSTVNFERGAALVHEHYPGASGDASGGSQHRVNLFRLGFLPRNATWLRGRYASVWADVNDDNRVQAAEKTDVPGVKGRAQFPLRHFRTAPGEVRCSPQFRCTWDPSQPRSWKRNMNQEAVQGLYAVSRFAQWLAKAPIGFTKSMGSFDRRDGDQANVHILDGADTRGGLPDGQHLNNASFNTRPDGAPGVMTLYLNAAPFLAAGAGQAMDNIAHEYAHGLSNRLVIDSSGSSTLHSFQAGGMGEGWSDFYSFDYLVARGFLDHSKAVPGELLYDRYLDRNTPLTRTEAIDCPVGVPAPNCRQLDGSTQGGYTYGDIAGALGTGVHNVGELWGQTLWEIRQRLGRQTAVRLITSAMTLSPDDPSMLDMRNAILSADRVLYEGDHYIALWQIFANRGLGFFAASIDAADAAPAEDFSTPPPASAARGTVSGVVSDGAGAPVADAVVLVAGFATGIDSGAVATTAADGSYSISGLAPGTYPKVVARAPGFEPDRTAVTIVSDQQTTADFTIRRDWAATSGGATVADFDGPDYTRFGCGPGGALDLSSGTGWGSVTTASEDAPAESAGDVVPKSLVIELPAAIDIASFAIDPSATCGDGGSSSTADYRLEVSTSVDGPWTEVAEGTFTPADQGTLVPVAASAPAAQTFVRYTMLSPQVPDFAECPDAFDGCQFMDTTEVAVYAD